VTDLSRREEAYSTRVPPWDIGRPQPAIETLSPLIRRARPADAAAIADIHVRTWQAAYEHVFGAERLATLDAAQREQRWRRSLEVGDQVGFVAEWDEVVVGWATVGPSYEEASWGELYGIYVAPEAWGTGAGSALIRAAADELRAHGLEDAVLWVLADNPRARRFYEREGWATDGARRTGEHLGVRTEELRYRISLS
jgi:ribosomal protein S18 acetylase RimI-like enzyme